MRKSQPIVILIIITMAIILAAGSFLALTYIQGRPETPAGTSAINVEGINVNLSTDPAKEVRVLGLQDVASAPTVQEQATEEQLDQTQGEPATPAAEATLAPTLAPEQVPAPAPAPVVFEQYVVQQNDTLHSVTLRPDTSIVLMALHGLSQDDLVPGAVIQLPVGNPAYCQLADWQPYAVGEGDTAFGISRRYGTTADILRDANNLDAGYSVFSGTIICVPRT